MATGDLVGIITVSFTILGTLTGLAVKAYKKASKKSRERTKVIENLERDNELAKEENESRKSETQLLIKATFAICDGLQQLGANGRVTKMYEELKNYVIEN